MLRPSRFVLLLLGSMTLAATFAAAQTREGVRTDITVTGPVTAIDHTARAVTMRAEQRSLVTVDVPASATYYDRVIIRLKRERRRLTAPCRRRPHRRPAVFRAGTLASQPVVTFTLTGWDATNRVVSFKGPT